MTDEIVGAVRSMTIVVLAGEFIPGPAWVPVTEFASSWGLRVPSPHPETVIVKVEPLEALGANEQPLAVPELEKSLAARPVIDSETLREKLIEEDVFVGVA